MCIGPIFGAAITDAITSLHVAEPLLLAVAAGIVAQAARISLRVAFQPRPGSGWRAEREERSGCRLPTRARTLGINRQQRAIIWRQRPVREPARDRGAATGSCVPVIGMSSAGGLTRNVVAVGVRGADLIQFGA
jgi:hypothetical protein